MHACRRSAPYRPCEALSKPHPSRSAIGGDHRFPAPAICRRWPACCNSSSKSQPDRYHLYPHPRSPVPEPVMHNVWICAPARPRLPIRTCSPCSGLSHWDWFDAAARGFATMGRLLASTSGWARMTRHGRGLHRHPEGTSPGSGFRNRAGRQDEIKNRCTSTSRERSRSVPIRAQSGASTLRRGGLVALAPP